MEFPQRKLSYIVILHQTTTPLRTLWGVSALSYIVILHQTTTRGILYIFIYSCLISLFYIKPQQCVFRYSLLLVVLYRYSTSNHNWIAVRDKAAHGCLISLFYIKPQLPLIMSWVYLSCLISLFYIKPQLSQQDSIRWYCCLISLFYIKPQHIASISLQISILANSRIYEVADVLNIILQKY